MSYFLKNIFNKLAFSKSPFKNTIENFIWSTTCSKLIFKKNHNEQNSSDLMKNRFTVKTTNKHHMRLRVIWNSYRLKRIQTHPQLESQNYIITYLEYPMITGLYALCFSKGWHYIVSYKIYAIMFVYKFKICSFFINFTFICFKFTYIRLYEILTQYDV